jgi:ferredoxin
MCALSTEPVVTPEGARPASAEQRLKEPGIPLPEPPEPFGTYVEAVQTGICLTVFWDSRFQSLLELAEACDVPVRWSCRTGVCHTCECGLISGSVKYDPEPLEPPAAGNLLICCSRPHEDMVIDI